MMITKRISLGFDLRERADSTENRLPEDQRLVIDTSNPLCADPSVWVQPNNIVDFIETVRPAFVNPLGLVARLEVLVDACKKRGILTENLSSLCVTTSEANILALNERFGSGYFENQITEGELLRSEWHFAGFDIVDLNGMISGLKGCGYKDPTWTRLRALFAGELNSIGLFSNVNAAYEFAEVRSLQIREHAPFVVAGIFENHGSTK